MRNEGPLITRAIFEANLAMKMGLPAFVDDIPKLLPPDVEFDLGVGIERVRREIIALLPGAPWSGGKT